MKLHQIHLVAGALMMLAACATVALTADWTSSASLAFLLAITVWPAVPLALATLGGWLLRRSRPALVSCFLGLLSVFVLVAALHVFAFFINPDPQGALILIFGPIYALVVLIPFGVTALVL